MTIDIRGHLPRIEIRVFDPKTASDQDWQAYHAYRRQRMHDDVPDEQIVSDDVRRRDMTRDWPLTEPRERLEQAPRQPAAEGQARLAGDLDGGDKG